MPSRIIVRISIIAKPPIASQKLVIAALGSPRYALRKVYTPPAQTGEAVEMYRCSYIRVPDYMADYMANRSSKDLRSVLSMLDICGIPQ